MKEKIALGKEYNKLITKYYKSINKACGVKAEAQFYQLETYFQSTIRLTIMEEILFIGEWPWDSSDPVHGKTKGRFSISPDGKEELKK